MTERIPHKDTNITETKTAEEYLKRYKMLGRFYLNKFVVSITKHSKKGSFLEIGSGSGNLAVTVAGCFPAARIKALEPSSNMINMAKEHVSSKGQEKKIEFIKGSIEDTSKVKSLGKFDLAYSTFSLHHWKDPKKAFINIYNSLRKDGVAIIQDFQRSGILYYIPLLPKGVFDSIRASYDKEEIEKILDEIGIKSYTIESKHPFLHIIIKKESNPDITDNSMFDDTKKSLFGNSTNSPFNNSNGSMFNDTNNFLKNDK